MDELRKTDNYESWMEGFQTSLNKYNEEQIITTEYNIKLVLNNDKTLSNKIVYNMFADRTEKTESMPWDIFCADDAIIHGNQFWTDDDFSGLLVYLGEKYGLRNKDMIRNVFQIYRKEHRYHPIRNYLRNLKWDGKTELKQYSSTSLALMIMLIYVRFQDCFLQQQSKEFSNQGASLTIY